MEKDREQTKRIIESQIKRLAVKKKREKRMLIVLGILLAFVIIFFFVRKGALAEVKTSLLYVWDKFAENGTLKDEQEFYDNLQQEADQTSFSFRIYTEPVFYKGDEEAQFLIGNPEVNWQGMRVAVVLDDTGETIYTTKVLKPGETIEKVKLDKVLDRGIYSATAVISAIDLDTENEIGQVAAALKIRIKN